MNFGGRDFQDVVEAGRGGFAIVYRAWQPSFHRSVAIKVMTSDLDQAAMMRFERECYAIGGLSGHPNIVTVYELGQTDDGRPFIVMEYLEGGSLGDRLEQHGPMAWADVVDIGVRVAGALESAHGREVLHRDVKPENILISRFGEPKLGDFGIARVQGNVETKSGVITASFAHAAPEILAGERPSVASDIYALGSALYTLLAGEPAFVRSTDESLLPVLARIPTEPVPDLVTRGVPASLFEVIERSMAKHPQGRQPSAKAMGVELQAVQVQHGLAKSPIAVEVDSTKPDPTSFTIKVDKSRSPRPSPTPTRKRARVATEKPQPVAAPTQTASRRHAEVTPAVDGAAPSRPDPRRHARPMLIAGAAALVVAAVAFVVFRGQGASSTGPVVLRDSFASSTSGWTQRSTAESDLSYDGGTYRMVVKQPDKVAISDTELEGAAFKPSLTRLGDVTVEADVQKVSAAAGVFGLVCREASGGHPTYQALIDTSGFWGLFRNDGTTTDTLTKGETAGSVRTGGVANHIRMDCLGAPGHVTTLRLFVNGRKLAEARDANGFAPGRAGLIAATNADPGLDVRFDNVVVRSGG